VTAFNGPLSLTWPAFDLSPAGSGLLGALRSFVAYWIAVFAAGAFVFCALLGIQGIVAQLPRRYFLRLSSVLQMASFALLFCGFFLEPSLSAPRALGAPLNRHLLALWPSYWFFGLFEYLNGWPAGLGPTHLQGYSGLNGAPADVVGWLAGRAWVALAVAVSVAAASFLLSYLRTIRKIVEEPDIVPGRRGASGCRPSATRCAPRSCSLPSAPSCAAASTA
jgi:hypothetical protein